MLVLVFGLSAAAAPAEELPLLHPLFTDHAVLQRDEPIRIWGWTAPGQDVTVSFAGAPASASADASGRWVATLPAMGAGGPHVLTARAQSGSTQSVHDVLVGDVWLCSGQSNMVLQVHRALDSRAEIAGSANDSIRMLTVGLATSTTPLESFRDPVEWQRAAPATVPEFSATCFFFARELQKTVRVPMGLINASWGGSKIQSWMSANAIRTAGGYESALDLLALFATDPVAANQRWGAAWEAWWRSTHPNSHEPWSRHARSRDWHAAPAALDAWEQWDVPELATFNGMVWYRTTVNLDAGKAAQPASLSLGPIDDVDETWVNGRAVGYTSGAAIDRLYQIPAGLLRAGENVIVVNVLDLYGSGGMYGAAEKRALRLADGTSIPIDGAWQYQIGPPNKEQPPRAPWEAMAGLSTIHNAMIAPLVPYGLRGVVWYQGEANTSEPERYEALLAGLIADWRGKFAPDLPFLVVQLANYGPASTAPVASGWASLREAQRLAVARDGRAGLAVTIDIGDRYDVHPANKQEVGRRLARAARHVVYGEAIIPSGPVPLSARREGSRAVVMFGDVEDQLVVYGSNRPIGFELCGGDQSSCRFVDAVAEGKRVWLEGGDLSPTRVRYCWADSPVCTLYDRSGLPAGPFEIAIE